MTAQEVAPRHEGSDATAGPAGDATAELLFGSRPRGSAHGSDDFVLQRMPGYLIRRLDSRANALFEAHTGQTALTARQFGLLKVVHDEGSVRQSGLASRLHLDRSTLGEMLARMVDRGLVVRRPAAEDRRTSEVRLTPAGEAALGENVLGALQAQRELLAPLPDYLRPVFMACLTMLAEADHLPSEPEDGVTS
jgi:DNA-binding MarR family transcriptional regulator